MRWYHLSWRDTNLCLMFGRDTLLRHSKSHGVCMAENPWAQPGTEGHETTSASSRSPHGDVAAAEAASIMAAFASPHQSSLAARHIDGVMTPSNTCTFTVDGQPSNDAASDDQIFSAQGTATTDMSPLEDGGDHRFTGLTPFTEDLTTQWSSYFAGNEFDIALLDPSLFTAPSEPQPLTLPQEPTVPAASNPKSPVPTPYMPFASATKSWIQRKWHTFSEGASSGYITPDVTEDRHSVDEICHRDLTERLQPRLQSGSLPSTTFLVRDSSAELPVSSLSIC